ERADRPGRRARGVLTGKGAQRRHLGGAELAPRAGLEVVHLDPAVARPVQAAHRMADRRAHPLHLVLAPLVQGQLDPPRAEPPRLLSNTYARPCLATRSPSTSTLSAAPTNVFSCPGSPLTRTRPALISSSARRREATPARAR